MPGGMWAKIALMLLAAAVGVGALLWVTGQGLERVVERWPVEEIQKP